MTERLCPGCGERNDGDRELCVRCGADLDSGIRQPSLDDRTEPVPVGAPAPTPTRLGSHVLVAVFAVLAVVGAIVGGLWAAGLGPFAPAAASLPPVPFPADRYPGEASFLALSDVAAAAVREPAHGRTFSPRHLVDADPTTAWHGDGGQLLEGMVETVDLYLATAAWVTGVVVANGDHQDAETYAAAGRVQRARLLFDGGVEHAAVLLDLGREPQLVELPVPVLTTSVRLELVEVIPGTEGTDPALSRLDVLGWDADDGDRRVASERAELRPAAGTISLPFAPSG